MPNGNSSTEGGTIINRRSMLKATGASIVGLSGCSGIGGSENFKLGLVTFRSGPYSANGEEVIRGAEVLVPHWNDNGGVDGRDVELIIGDSEGDADRAIQQTRRLTTEEDVDLLGCFLSSPEATGAMNVAARNETPLATCSTGNDALVTEECNQYAFRGPSGSSTNARAGGADAVQRFGEDVFQVNPDYSWGQEIQASWQTSIENAGGNVVESQFLELGASDFSSALSAIESADPDCVQIGQAGSGAVSFFTQYEQQGLDIPVYVHSLYETSLAGVSSDLVNNVPIYSPLEYTYQIDTSTNQTFVDDFQDENDHAPTVAAGQTYRHIDVGLQAADENGGMDGFVDHFEDWSGSTITRNYTMRGCDHQGQYPMYISRVTADGDTLGWNVEGTVAAADILPSCSDMTAQMNCSIDG